jgi:threonine dehydrogenase-like Zn-dependent dehydrogenase
VLSEPLAVVMHAVGKLPRPPRRALVLGYGPVGALVHLEIARRWPQTAVAAREVDPGRRRLAAASWMPQATPAPWPTRYR